jgi:hypothetical protein
VRRVVPILFVLTAIAAFLAPSVGLGSPRDVSRTACSSGYVDGVIGGKHKCLRAGEFCSPQYESDYEHYGFSCVSGRLQSGGTQPPATTAGTTMPATTVATTTLPAPTTVATTTTAITTTAVTTTSPSPIGPPPLGRTVVLARRTKTSHCRLGMRPDRRCSPGAYYSGLTKAVICSSTFRTSRIRSVPTSEKHAVEIEYGMAPKAYGRTLEIDHIVSLELGGSNDIANLFPERAPGYRSKDKLENKMHKLVCAGDYTLVEAQHQIARDWVTLYITVFGKRP